MGRGRAPCCEKMGLKKGPWAPSEDMRLIAYIRKHGHGNWRALPKQAGLLRCGKSCRLRWINYLRPDIKRGNFTPEEEETIIKLHESLGNRWSTIASRLPGRTDNEIKNVWNTHIKKRLVSRGPNPSTDEPKESPNSSSSSPSSSSGSSLLYSGQIGEVLLDEQLDLEALNIAIKDTEEDPLEDLLQIPIKPDLELLDMLEDYSSSSTSPGGTPMDYNEAQQISILNRKSAEEVQSKSWITYLENELELWSSDHSDLDSMKDTIEVEPVNSSFVCDGIFNEEIDPVSIYFQKWPSSPSIFSL